MLEKIQQAETAIKSGDTRTGFQILRDVLAKNPNSERAWWVMSGLVPREQRAHCLNQVLRVNPNNQMARETLENLRPEKPETEPTETEKPSAPQGKGTLGGYQTWLFAQRSRIFLTLLGEEELISGETEPKNLARIRAAFRRRSCQFTSPTSRCSILPPRRESASVFVQVKTERRSGIFVLIPLQ